MQRSTLAKIGLTAVVALAGVGFLVKSSVGSAQHYKKVDELMLTDLAGWKGKELKVHGWVQAGTIIEKTVAQETLRTFVLQYKGKTIRVFNKGPRPDTFKDQSEVVATGHIVPTATMVEHAKQLGVMIDADMAYVVDSSELMAKCPSKYDGAQGNKKIDTKYQ